MRNYLGLLENVNKFLKLYEKKDHIIKKLPGLSDQEKERVIKFFETHPNLESKIDWNDKELGMDTFESIMKNAEKSRSSVKKQTSKDLSVPFRDLIDNKKAHLWYADNKIILISPLSWSCAIFMNSFNCYGIGAQWCIGTENNPDYWNNYVIRDGVTFIFVYDKILKEKWMIERDEDKKYSVWDSTDNRIILPIPKLFDIFIEMKLNIDYENGTKTINDIETNIDSIFGVCQEEENIQKKFLKELHEKYYDYVLKGKIKPTLLYGEMLDEYQSKYPEGHFMTIKNKSEAIIKEILDYYENEYVKGNIDELDPELMLDFYLSNYSNKKGEYTEREFGWAKKEWEVQLKELEKKRKMNESIIFENIYRLREKKDHIIKKMSQLNDSEKDVAIDFFNKHPNYENDIDWNNYKKISFKDIEKIMNKAEDSKTNIAKKSRSSDLEAIWKTKKQNDYKILWNNNQDIYIAPGSHKCAIFMNSFSCYGVGAKWCIGTKGDDHYWKRYVIGDHSNFIMRYSKIDNKKYMIQIQNIKSYGSLITVWNQEDQKIVPGVSLSEVSKHKKYKEDVGSILSKGLGEFKKIIAEDDKWFERIREIYYSEHDFDADDDELANNYSYIAREIIYGDIKTDIEQRIKDEDEETMEYVADGIYDILFDYFKGTIFDYVGLQIGFDEEGSMDEDYFCTLEGVNNPSAAEDFRDIFIEMLNTIPLYGTGWNNE